MRADGHWAWWAAAVAAAAALTLAGSIAWHGAAVPTQTAALRTGKPVGVAALPLPGPVPATVALPATGSAAAAVARQPAAHGVALERAPQDGRSALGAAAAPPDALPIPVLMYHVVATPSRGAPWPSLYVAAPLFAAQMRALAHAGYRAVTLTQAVAIWRGHATAPPHPLVITFDDGYTSQYTAAFPVLRALGWPGVVCQQVGRIDIRGGLSAAQLRALVGAGWEIADHAVTQPEVDLTTAPPAIVHFEVFDSRARLEAILGRSVGSFCYPLGHYDPATVAAVRAAGFTAAVSSFPGPADPAVDGFLRLDRVRVSGGESPASLVRAVRAALTVPPRAPPARFPRGGRR